jgi:hypothetical protein
MCCVWLSEKVRCRVRDWNRLSRCPLRFPASADRELSLLFDVRKLGAVEERDRRLNGGFKEREERKRREKRWEREEDFVR